MQRETNGSRTHMCLCTDAAGVTCYFRCNGGMYCHWGERPKFKDEEVKQLHHMAHRTLKYLAPPKRALDYSRKKFEFISCCSCWWGSENEINLCFPPHQLNTCCVLSQGRLCQRLFVEAYVDSFQANENSSRRININSRSDRRRKCNVTD